MYSQKNEEEIIEKIFNKLDINKGTFVEVGAGDGITLSNTRKLFENGWNGIYIEGDSDKLFDLYKNTLGCFGGECVSRNSERIKCINKYISCEPGYRLDDILENCNNFPFFFDFLSLDIDGNDYYVWKGLTKYFPRLICVEYNPNFLSTESRSIEYDPNFRHDGTNYYGASARALYNLGISKGYTLIDYTEDLNLFFIHNTYSNLFENFDIHKIPKHIHHMPSDKKMITV